MAGGMGVRKNEHIEHWAWRRENAEFFFKYSRANWARLAVFGFGVPLAVYHIIVNEITGSRSISQSQYARIGFKPEFPFHPSKDK